MGDVVFRRSPRAPVPDPPSGEVRLQTPPELPRPTPQPVFQRVMPLVMLVAVVGSMVFMFRGGMARNPMAMMFPAMMALSALGMLATTFGGGNSRAETDELRKDYLRYLGRIRGEVLETATAQRAAATHLHPDPTELGSLVGTPRMWERTAGDADHLTVRVGPGRQALSTGLVAPDTGPVEDLEPVSVVSMHRFVRVHSLVDDVPVAMHLRGFSALSVDGEPERVRAWVRSVLAGLVTLHGPDDVRVAVAAREDASRRAWEWLKWLPHHEHPSFTDGGGRVRLTEFSPGGVEAMLAGELDGRGSFSPSARAEAHRAHLVVVVDGVACTGTERIVTGGGVDGVTVIEVCGSRAGHLRALAVDSGLCLRVDDGGVHVLSADGEEEIAAADTTSLPEVEQLARALGRYRLADQLTLSDGTTATRRSPGLPDLLGLGPAQSVDPAVAWRPRGNRERLRVPFGVTPDGTPVALDLKEAAHGGMGPHGVCIGATGSGKSEFLRTLVLGLVATHDPDALNLVLVDFKGGATFLGLDGVAHVSAVITNLQAEMTMVDRMRAALEGELTRRQELLRSASVANVTEYEAARARGADLAPLPALFIVVDEFSELLAARPEFADLFLTIGRLGRSLHIHLLLASQRLEEGRLRGLDSHLSYRIALKTFSAAESRSVLGVTDAYHLPPTPGAGYLKIDSSDPIRFDAAYVSGPLAADRGPVGDRDTAPAQATTRAFTSWYMPVVAPLEDRRSAPTPLAPGDDRTLLEVLVSRLEGHGRTAHEVWLPPLGVSAPLDGVVGPSPVAPAGPGPVLAIPVAEVDLPFEQRRDVHAVELSGGNGNMAVVGGTRSGKSTLLRTLVLAAAVLNPPDRISFYCLDLGGGTLAPLAGLPHVGVVAHRGDPDRIRRTVAEVVAELRRRESAFREAGFSSVEQARRRTVTREGREVAEFPEVVLVIDGWQVLRTDHEALEQTVTTLAADGLSFGVHVVLASGRWAEIRPALRDVLGTRVELRLGDPSDSMIDRRTSQAVPADAPGRGLTPTGDHLLVLQPRLDGGADHDGMDEATVSAVRSVAARWTHLAGDTRAASVRMLPDVLPYSQLAGLARPGPDGARRAVPVGVDEAELGVVYVDFAAEPLQLVFGDSGSGKTSLIRSVARGLVVGNAPSSAKLLLVDFRRTMLGEFDTDHVAGYAATRSALEPMIDHLVRILESRMPGPDTTPEQLRARSWWEGPEVHVLVDDLDLVITGAGNPLAPLAPYLPHARDVGLSVLLARRAAGAARAVYDPFVSSMRDLGCAGLLLDGSRDEGVLVSGVRPSAQPPGRGVYVTRAAGPRVVQTTWCAS